MSKKIRILLNPSLKTKASIFFKEWINLMMEIISILALLAVIAISISLSLLIVHYLPLGSFIFFGFLVTLWIAYGRSSKHWNEGIKV